MLVPLTCNRNREKVAILFFIDIGNMLAVTNKTLKVMEGTRHFFLLKICTYIHRLETIFTGFMKYIYINRIIYLSMDNIKWEK